MRVLVVGAGVGGLAIANGLLGKGHDVHVYEHAEALRTTGAGITVWSNGTAALRELGVDIEPHGHPLRSLRSLVPRMERHAANALAVAKAIEGHPALEALLYPGLPAHHAQPARRGGRVE